MYEDNQVHEDDLSKPHHRLIRRGSFVEYNARGDLLVNSVRPTPCMSCGRVVSSDEVVLPLRGERCCNRCHAKAKAN